jgi:hypothetical protein
LHIEERKYCNHLLTERAVRATVTDVALATKLLGPVVAAGVGSNFAVRERNTAVSDETSLRLARTVARAIVGADGCTEKKREIALMTVIKCQFIAAEAGLQKLTSFASHTSVTDVAAALATDTIASTTARALLLLVGSVGITKVEHAALVVG